MNIPEIFKIKEADTKLEPGKLALAGIIISAIVFALVVYSKIGYYDTKYAQGAYPDLSSCFTRKVISIALSVIPSVLLIVFHLIVKFKNKTSKFLAVFLLIAIVLLCANGVFETFSLVNAYLTEDELRKDLCFVLIGCHILSAGSASNGLKMLKILPPA